MSDIGDDEDDLDEDAARDELTRKLRTEGAMIAYRTAVDICRDPKATAAAKASAVNSLFRAGGFFANQEIGEGAKDVSEMTPAEVTAALRIAKSELIRRQETVAKPGPTVFD